MSARNDWAQGLLELHGIWCDAMDKLRAAGLSDDEAAEVVIAWLRAELGTKGVTA